jgi:GNAT superfamily N-acetyltransferase
MEFHIIHDKAPIAAFCRENPFLHLYSLGDLDDFFWKYTTWFGLIDGTRLRELVLLYQGPSVSTLLGLSEDILEMKNLLESIVGFLPRRFNAHLSPGLEEVLAQHYLIKPYGKNYKMMMDDKSVIKNFDYSGVTRLSTDDHESIRELYEQGYPGNWFDSRMLETNQYFGIREGNKLVSIAGVHVYSETYRVAALGNITTLPRYRAKGFGKKVTGRLCQSLLEKTDHIGLNVKSDNQYAICLYENLGFKKFASYNEFVMDVK